MGTPYEHKKSIILIGMPASGKSTIGVKLARRLEMKFIDTDKMIERREKMTLQQIIECHGTEYFEKSEEGVLMSLKPRGQVIATGGSAVLYPKAMKHLKKLGIIIYLDLPLYALKRRLWNLQTRGIVFRSGQNLTGAYHERKPLYEKHCDFSVQSGTGGAGKVIQSIITELERQGYKE